MVAFFFKLQLCIFFSFLIFFLFLVFILLSSSINPLNPELNPICYLLALLPHYFLHVSRIRVKSLTLRLLMSYIYIYIYMTLVTEGLNYCCL